MIRTLTLAALAWTLAAAGATANVDQLHGTWRGEAELAGQVTPISVEFEPCAEGLCGRLSLPDLAIADLPIGAVNEAGETVQIGPLSLATNGPNLTGELAGHGGGVFIAAMGHGDGAARVSLSRSAAQESGFVEEDVRFESGPVTLAGTLIRPQARGPHPAIVAVLGSGDAVRWYSVARAREWARLGFAVLVYDKRGAGASSGDWTRASLDDLSDDVIAAVRYLRGRGEIQAGHIGLWAHSQGGWVAPRAIARGAEVAFLIAVSGGGATPRQVEQYGYAGALNHMDVSDAERERAEALIERYFAYLGGEIDRATLQTDVEAVRNAAWYRGLGIGRVIPSEANLRSWQWVALYQPEQDIAALNIPTFVALAGADHSTPLSDSVAAWTHALASNGAPTRISVYPGADHHLRIGNTGWRRVSPVYAADLERFLLEQRP